MLKQRIVAGFVLLCSLGVLAASLVQADGIVIPEPIVCGTCPPPAEHDVPYLTVETHRVTVSIDQQVATTRVDQVFRNDSQWSMEGTYIFPLPEAAAISDFAMWVDGERIEGHLYTKEEARAIYDEIVRQRMDPALLEYIGRDLFQASIFPIEPGDTRRVEIEYTEILPVDNGLVQYIYPLSTERFSAEPLEDVSVTVDINSADPIKAIYSPSHAVSVSREGRYEAIVGWEASNVKPATDFSLYYTVSPEDVGVNLLSYQEPGEDGFFMLFVAPDIEAGTVVEKDVILVLDTSGSMAGGKLEQAQDALTFVLDNLNTGDRFNIIAFETGIRAFSDRPEPLSMREEARQFVNGLSAAGSTDINRALLEAISGTDSERPTIIIFLTDGLPTSGVVERELILHNVDMAATPNLRIFPFGVGDDVDTFLLDSLAQEQRGASAYVRPNERVDEQVSAFYARVSTPVLADVDIHVDGGVRIEDAYPYPLPDLFAGTQLIIAGRYRDGGPASVTLTGQVNGDPQTFVYDDLTFTSNRIYRTSFIPRLWATRKVGYLLNQVRLHGEDREIIDQIVDLSIRYGIITPYTSFLVEEPELALSDEGRNQIADEEFAEAEAAPDMVSGAGAVDRSVAENSMADSAVPLPTPTRAPQATAPPSGGRGGGGNAPAVTAQENAAPEVDASRATEISVVGAKTFLLLDGVWIDTVYDTDTMVPEVLVFGSDEFFDLLAAHPDAGAFFALGEQVIVVIDGVAYQSMP